MWPAWQNQRVSVELHLLSPLRLSLQVLSLTLALGLSWPVHGTRISGLYPYIEAEARYACRREYALNAVDFVARRTRLSFLNVRVTLECLPRIIDIMGEELGWDGKRKEAEFEGAQEFLRSMGLPEVCQDPRLIQSLSLQTTIQPSSKDEDFAVLKQ